MTQAGGMESDPGLPEGQSLPPGVADELAARARQILGRGDTGIADSLPSDVELVAGWPDRIALIVGEEPRPGLFAVLERRGLNPVVVAPELARTRAAQLGPFVFLLVTPAALRQDSDAELIRVVHRMSPAARGILVADQAEQDGLLLRRAIRAGLADIIDPSDELEVERIVGAGLVAAGFARERVLAIGAHPDDVEIGCGGTLLDHRRRGDRISILTLSRGAVGGATDDRTAEAIDTARYIGAQLMLADLPDTRVSDGIDTIRLIEGVVAAIDPTVVYVHSPNDNHQDHRAVNIATVSATRRVRRLFGYQSPSATNLFTPSQFVSIDDVLREKVRVLDMFGSQDGRVYLEPEMVISAARYWARHLSASARYAEPFEVIRSVGDLRHLATAPNLALEHTALATVAELIPAELTRAQA
jgi:LmbE family N-acetylglucosaminyl deacetylase